MDTIRCEACGGTGKGPVRFGRAGTSGAARNACPKCGGRGVVNAPGLAAREVWAKARTNTGAYDGAEMASRADAQIDEDEAKEQKVSPDIDFKEINRKRYSLFFSATVGAFFTFYFYYFTELGSSDYFKGFDGQFKIMGLGGTTLIASSRIIQLVMNKVLVDMSDEAFRTFKFAFRVVLVGAIAVWLFATPVKVPQQSGWGTLPTISSEIPRD
jgi:hypothetical protein